RSPESRRELRISRARRYLTRDSDGLTFFRSAARGQRVAAARRNASRCPSGGSRGPANGRASAAAKSWAARDEAARSLAATCLAEHLRVAARRQLKHFLLKVAEFTKICERENSEDH